MEDTVMTTFDFAPLFRTSIGYDRLASLMNAAHRGETGNGFPPYNIQKAGEDKYRITMAVAGFSEGDCRSPRKTTSSPSRATSPRKSRARTTLTCTAASQRVPLSGASTLRTT
jgi:molecular chaperone IbpA